MWTEWSLPVDASPCLLSTNASPLLIYRYLVLHGNYAGRNAPQRSSVDSGQVDGDSGMGLNTMFLYIEAASTRSRRRQAWSEGRAGEATPRGARPSAQSPVVSARAKPCYGGADWLQECPACQLCDNRTHDEHGNGGSGKDLATPKHGFGQPMR